MEIRSVVWVLFALLLAVTAVENEAPKYREYVPDPLKPTTIRNTMFVRMNVTAPWAETSSTLACHATRIRDRYITAAHCLTKDSKVVDASIVLWDDLGNSCTAKASGLERYLKIQKPEADYAWLDCQPAEDGSAPSVGKEFEVGEPLVGGRKEKIWIAITAFFDTDVFPNATAEIIPDHKQFGGASELALSVVFGEPPTKTYSLGRIQQRTIEGTVYHNAPTVAGFAGAGIYQFQTGTWYLVAMHVGIEKSNQLDFGLTLLDIIEREKPAKHDSSEL